MRYVSIDPRSPRMVVTGAPGIPVPPGAVDAECARCEKAVKIARSTARMLRADPDLPLLCWDCVKVLLPEWAVEPPVVTGVAEGRRRMGTRRNEGRRR